MRSKKSSKTPLRQTAAIPKEGWAGSSARDTRSSDSCTRTACGKKNDISVSLSKLSFYQWPHPLQQEVYQLPRHQLKLSWKLPKQPHALPLGVECMEIVYELLSGPVVLPLRPHLVKDLQRAIITHHPRQTFGGKASDRSWRKGLTHEYLVVCGAQRGLVYGQEPEEAHEPGQRLRQASFSGRSSKEASHIHQRLHFQRWVRASAAAARLLPRIYGQSNTF